MLRLGSTRARMLGVWYGRGRVPNLYVYPKVKVEIAGSAFLDVKGCLSLGERGIVGRYSPSFAFFGNDSKTTVSGKFSIFGGFFLAVYEGAEFRCGSGFFNHSSQIVCSRKITIGDACMFGPQVAVRDDDEHDFNNSPRIAPVKIGN